MILDPSVAFEMLHTLNRRDLAILVLLAMAADDEEDSFTSAAVRIEKAVDVIQDSMKKEDTRRWTRKRLELHKHIMYLADRVVPMLRQVGQYEGSRDLSRRKLRRTVANR